MKGSARRPNGLARAEGLRELLLKDHRKRMKRWHIPGKVCDYEQALVAGEAIVLDAATLMCALMHAGLPCDRFAFGGADWGKSLLLDERDQLSEYAE